MFYIEIDLHNVRKCLCESICKAEVDQEASEASWLETVEQRHGGFHLRCDVISGFAFK